MSTLTLGGHELPFEHSLVSLSEWEAKYEKAFYSFTENDKRSEEEWLSYFEFMYVGKKKYFHLVRLIDSEQMLEMAQYINAARTATVVREVQKKPGPKENVPSELIYYWLTAFKIPFHPTETWHLNRLLMLVKVCGAKSATPTKRTPQDRAKAAMTMREENERRRAAMKTKG